MRAITEFPDLRSERGAILVQAAVASLVLVGFAAFVLDAGILWVSRNQAQNAADAGAMAGALARAYDDFTDPPPANGLVVEAASEVAASNLVWAGSPTSVVSFDCPPWVAGVPCVRVEVYRDGEAGSVPLPTLFAQVFGITSQGVKATATAQVAVGNATQCLRPFAIPDTWIQAPGVPTPGDMLGNQCLMESGGAPCFEKYDPNTGSLLTPHDDYVAPSGVGSGSGLTSALTPTGDLGLQVTLTFSDGPNSPIPGFTVQGPTNNGWLLPLDLPGGSTYDGNIAACNGQLIAVTQPPQQVPLSTTAAAGQTTDDLALLIAQDPGASWNTSTNAIDGSCAPVCASLSPRLVALSVFNPDTYQYQNATNDWSACPGAAPCISIVNLLGFFIDHIQAPGVVVGYLTKYPGLVSAPNQLVAQSSFLPAVTLVR